MKALRLPAIESSPEVILDKYTNEFKFSGKSFPEDARVIYNPIIEWAEEYVANPNDRTVVEFNMIYFNSATANLLLDILEVFAKLLDDDKEVVMHWYYKECDEDMKYAGELYSEESKVPLELISYE